MIDKFVLQPIDDRVVVEPDEGPSETAGGIVLPDTAKEKPQRGTVLAAGEIAELHVHVGDVVIFKQYAGTDVELDGGRTVKVLKAEDLLAKVVGDG